MRIKEIIKILISRTPIVSGNRIHVGKNRLIRNNAVLRRCDIECNGMNNVIEFIGGGGSSSQFDNVKIRIYGNDNVITIEENVLAREACFWIEDDCNKIQIGKNSKLCGKIQLACIEGTDIYIGEDCLFSSDIVFRTGDSHSIFDKNGNRINISKDISIGNHVWLGQGVTINKGVKLADNIVVGAHSLLTKSISEDNTIIAGIPARVVKKDIKWTMQRVNVLNDIEK